MVTSFDLYSGNHQTVHYLELKTNYTIILM